MTIKSSYGVIRLMSHYQHSKKRYTDTLLHTEKIKADRKSFYIDLKENERGKVITITEDVSGNRDKIMVPYEILEEFITALENTKKAAKA